MSDKELFELSGVVLRKFPTEFGVGQNGKKWAKNKFVLKTTEGRDLYISKFGNFDTKLLGQDVSFKATKFNDTNFTVQGDIATGMSNPPEVVKQEPVQTTEQQSVAKRGRPKKVEPVVTVGPVKELKVDNNSDVSEAARIVIANIQEAIEIKQELGLETVDLIALADMVGRTKVALRIEANKDRRMDSFRK